MKLTEYSPYLVATILETVVKISTPLSISTVPQNMKFKRSGSSGSHVLESGRELDESKPT